MNSDDRLPQSRDKVLKSDALLLDDEMARIIEGWLAGVLGGIDPGLRVRYLGVIRAFSAVLAKLGPILVFRGTFGMQLQGLRFAALSKLRLLFYIAIEFLVPQLLRLANCPPEAETIWDLATLLNHLFFLASGQHPSLPLRLAGLDMAADQPAGPMSVDYEYMKRQLWWQALTETALLLTPLVRQAWRYAHRATAIWRRMKSQTTKLVAMTDGTQLCVVCQRTPAMTRRLHGCQHIACYYCAESLDRIRMPCPKCQQ
jgi:hypothetical protein